jgi:Rrf2 family transcriptional regulator, iron-sulfur cluster assembly transcription factor
MLFIFRSKNILDYFSGSLYISFQLALIKEPPVKLTTKGRYAVTAAMDLALHYDEGAASLAAISERQDISLSYLEQLFSRLRKNNIVVSIRGPGGGYQLARDPDQISIAEIVFAVDEKVETTNCGGAHDCHEGDEPCLTHDLWEALSEQITDFLSKISLGYLVKRHLNQKKGIEQDVIVPTVDFSVGANEVS